jgi:AcrR family transcriptional regulator
LFAANGYEGTSTRAIGAAAGANIAMIAYHFGDKEGLYNEVLRTTNERLLALELPSALPPQPAARIRALVAAAYSYGRARQHDVRLLMRHVTQHGALPDAVRAESTARLFEKVGELTEAAGLSGLAERRLELMSINHLITRYVVSDLADVQLLVGEDDPDLAISRHLGDVAVQLLLHPRDGQNDPIQDS